MKINIPFVACARRIICVILTAVFSVTSTVIPAQAGPGPVQPLPVPGEMVTLSPTMDPVLLKGITVHPEDPLRFDFIVDSGQSDADRERIQQESERLIKYFLASMTVPKDDLWVNLSPYEGDKIIPDELGKTELGRDLLAQDYLLKQLTASLIYPEEDLGADFWNKIYAKAQAEFGTTDIPLDTFNKVWILPDHAEVYQNGNTVYVVNARMKVMLDSDYQAQHNGIEDRQQNISKDVVREVLLPVIEKEVNEGENFAALRQIYYSLILAKWYKNTVTESLLHKIYIDQNKVAGVDDVDEEVRNEIYARYMQAYQKGVFNYIKEDYDRLSGESLPRKYFSGGFKDADIVIDQAVTAEDRGGDKYLVAVGITPEGVEMGDNAMMGRRDFIRVSAAALLALGAGQISVAQAQGRIEYEEALRLLRQPDTQTFLNNELTQLSGYSNTIIWLQRVVQSEDDPVLVYNALRGLGVLGGPQQYSTINRMLSGYNIDPRLRLGAVEALRDQLDSSGDRRAVPLLVSFLRRQDITEAHIVAVQAIIQYGDLDDLNFIESRGGVHAYYRGDPDLLQRFEESLDVPTTRYATEWTKRVLPYVGYTAAGIAVFAGFIYAYRGAVRKYRGGRFYNLRVLNGRDSLLAKGAAKYFMAKGNSPVLLSAKKHIPQIYQAMVEYYGEIPEVISQKKEGSKEEINVPNPDYATSRAAARAIIEEFEVAHVINPRFDFGDTDAAADKAVLVSSVSKPDTDVGGIDMNNIPISAGGAVQAVRFDTSVLDALVDQPVQGFTPVIIQVIPIPSVLPLLGLQEPEAGPPVKVSRLSPAR